MKRFCLPIVAIVVCVSASLASAQVDTAWVRLYDGPGGGADYGRAIAADDSGNVYATGSSVGAAANNDYATVKYDAAGVQQWAARYDGLGSGSDEAQAIAVDDSGNVYVTGVSYGGPDSLTDYATVKYDAAGVQQWAARYNGPASSEDFARSIAVDGAGCVYVTGWSWSLSSREYATVKYDPDGVELWVGRYQGPGAGSDEAHALCLDDSANVYVTGQSWGVGTARDFATIRYDSAGTQDWVARYDGGGYDDGLAIATDAAGWVYVTGVSVGTVNDIVTVMYSSAGVEQWSARYNGPGDGIDEPSAVVPDGAGGVHVTGRSLGLGTDYDYVTLTYDSAGSERWVARYNGTGNGTDRAYGLAVGGSGDVYVTGQSVSSGGSSDYATVAYDSAGNLEWATSYDGPGNGSDQANAVTVDGDGYVCVTGLVQVAGADYDYATIKYGFPDVGVTAIVVPVGVIDSGAVVTPACSVHNYGVLAETYTVGMAIGPDYYVERVVTDHVPGTGRQVEFADWSPTRRGACVVSCSTRLADDARPENDRMTDSTWMRVTDVAATAILAPAGTVDSGAVVVPQTVVKNFGTDSADVLVWFGIHGPVGEAIAGIEPGRMAFSPGGVGLLSTAGRSAIDQEYQDSIRVALGPGDTAVCEFTRWTAVDPGSYDVASVVRLPGDMNPANDSVSGAVVVAWPVHDVGAIEIVEPVGRIDSATVVIPKAIVENFGTLAETFFAKFTVGIVYADVRQVTVAAGAADPVEFAAWEAVQVGTHATRCSTMLVSDSGPANDLVEDSVIVIPGVGVAEQTVLPTDFVLGSGMPNPFRARVAIRYGLPRPGRVNIAVYSATGELVRTLASGLREPGFDYAVWDGCDEQGRRSGRGVYYCLMVADEFRDVKKLVRIE